jgi:hypothetical protein
MVQPVLSDRVFSSMSGVLPMLPYLFRASMPAPCVMPLTEAYQAVRGITTRDAHGMHWIADWNDT